MGIVEKIVGKLIYCFQTCPLTTVTVLLVLGGLVWLYQLLKPKGRNPFNVKSVRPKERLETDVKKRDAVIKQVIYLYISTANS